VDDAMRGALLWSGFGGRGARCRPRAVSPPGREPCEFVRDAVGRNSHRSRAAGRHARAARRTCAARSRAAGREPRPPAPCWFPCGSISCQPFPARLHGSSAPRDTSRHAQPRPRAGM